jgi:NAD(P)-dependent dehydrogenase (short-subunit alcohol dehydrogenase family)
MSVRYSDLAGKHVVVTGGGSGIGEAIVRAFAGQGAKVGFLDIAEEPSRALAAELGPSVVYAACDLRDIAQLRAGFAELRAANGPVNILVNNAAHDERHKFADVTPEFFDERVAVNLRHAYFAAQEAIPDMRAAGGGAVVNFGSVSWMSGSADLSVYATLKSAAHGLTRVLAREFGPDNIRVNCVVPGWIMTKRQIEKWLTPEGEKSIYERQCLKRKLQPPEIAQAVLFLASDAASAITNQQLIVDGGWI